MDIYQILVTHNRTWSAREIVFVSAAFLVVLLFASSLYLSRKILLSQMIAGLLAFLFLAVVFASTVFTRTPSNERKYMLQMFWSWERVFVNHSREMLKENLLNCVLLFPFGVLLPVMCHRRISWWKSYLCGFFISAVIETSQLVFYRGLFEWDDMIHNALGCMIGCLIAGRLIFRRSSSPGRSRRDRSKRDRSRRNRIRRNRIRRNLET